VSATSPGAALPEQVIAEDKAVGAHSVDSVKHVIKRSNIPITTRANDPVADLPSRQRQTIAVAAPRYRLSVRGLVLQLLSIIAADDMFDAILDERGQEL
jgi:hypothetical protein